jgi:chemotaxis methyl-accepting protein methylase
MNTVWRLESRGVLILGKTETMTPQMLDLFEVVEVRERIYRKESALSLRA